MNTVRLTDSVDHPLIWYGAVPPPFLHFPLIYLQVLVNSKPAINTHAKEYTKSVIKNADILKCFG